MEGSRAGRADRRSRIRRRRSTALVLGAVALSVGALVAWFPGSTLVHERQDLAAAATQLHHLRQENGTLGRESAALKDPATAAALARQQYGVTTAGQQAFQVLPPASGHGAGEYAGDPGLQPVAVPNTGSDLPGTVTPQGAAGGSSHGPSQAPSQATARAGGGAGRTSFWGRVEQTLEFWR